MEGKSKYEKTLTKTELEKYFTLAVRNLEFYITTNMNSVENTIRESNSIMM